MIDAGGERESPPAVPAGGPGGFGTELRDSVTEALSPADSAQNCAAQVVNPMDSVPNATAPPTMPVGKFLRACERAARATVDRHLRDGAHDAAGRKRPRRGRPDPNLNPRRRRARDSVLLQREAAESPRCQGKLSLRLGASSTRRLSRHVGFAVAGGVAGACTSPLIFAR